MSNLFELAIFALKRERSKAAIDDPCPICSYDAAIRVLEAAGKVDKELAIKTLRRLYHPRFNQGPDPISVPIFDAIMPLLEALPEPKP